MKITNEAKIGIFVVIVLLGLAAFTWKTVGYDFIPKGYELKALFKNIDNVELNAPVTLNGLEVGRVDGIRLIYGEATRIELKLWMKEEAKVHRGARAFVKNMGFMGEKYVALTSGDDGAPVLAPGETIEGKTPVDFEEVMAKGDAIATNLKSISGQLDERLRVNSEAIDQIFVDLRATMSNMTSISGNLKERLDVNGHLIDEAIAHLDLTSKNLEEMSYDIKENPWKLLYKPKTRD